MTCMQAAILVWRAVSRPMLSPNGTEANGARWGRGWDQVEPFMRWRYRDPTCMQGAFSLWLMALLAIISRNGMDILGRPLDPAWTMKSMRWRYQEVTCMPAVLFPEQAALLSIKSPNGMEPIGRHWGRECKADAV